MSAATCLGILGALVVLGAFIELALRTAIGFYLFPSALPEFVIGGFLLGIAALLATRDGRSSEDGE